MALNGFKSFDLLYGRVFDGVKENFKNGREINAVAMALASPLLTPVVLLDSVRDENSFYSLGQNVGRTPTFVETLSTLPFAVAAALAEVTVAPVIGGAAKLAKKLTKPSPAQ